MTKKKKRCTKCEEAKLLNEFHRCASSRDGRKSQCKICRNTNNRKWAKDNPKKMSTAVKRWRNEHREQHQAGQRRRYKENPEPHRRETRAYAKAHPEETRARRRVNNAVKSGRLVHPARCGRCRKRRKVHGHHDDYSKPLKVRWLCSVCHSEVHQDKGQEWPAK